MLSATTTILEGLSGWILVAEVAKEGAAYALKKYSAADLKRRYGIDATRREYLKSVGQGTFVGVSLPTAPGH